MICPWCGANVAQTKFCENCGGLLEGAVDSAPAFDSANYSTDNSANYNSPSFAPSQSAQPEAWQPSAQQTGQPGAYQPSSASGMPQGSSPVPPAGTRAGFQQGQPNPYQQPYQAAGQQGYQQGYQPGGQQGYQQGYPGQPAGGAPAGGPWYGKSWVIVLFLLFLWPVGLILMWKKTCGWTKTAKIIVTVAIGLLVLFNVVTSIGMMGEIVESSSTPSPSAAPATVESKSSAATDVSDKASSEAAASSASSESAAAVEAEASQSSSSAAAEIDDAKFVGTWQLVSMMSGDESISEEELQLAADLGMEITLTLNEDGSALLSMPEEEEITSTSGTWAASSDTTVGFMFDGSLAVARMENERLIMEEDDLQLVFKKK